MSLAHMLNQEENIQKLTMLSTKRNDIEKNDSVHQLAARSLPGDCFTKTYKLFPSSCHPSSSSNCRFNNSTSTLLSTRNLEMWFKEPKGNSSDKWHTSPASEVPFLHQSTCIFSALSRKCDVWVCSLRSKIIKTLAPGPGRCTRVHHEAGQGEPSCVWSRRWHRTPRSLSC